jgi:hypothetical protein
VNPINAVGDKTGAELENGVVIPSPGLNEAYQFCCKNQPLPGQAVSLEGFKLLLLSAFASSLFLFFLAGRYVSMLEISQEEILSCLLSFPLGR